MLYLWCKRSWLCGSWIYLICNRCLSSLMLWLRIPLMPRCTTLWNKVCQWLAAGRWFSPGTPVSSTNKTDCHDITDILLKVALNTILPTKSIYTAYYLFTVLSKRLSLELTLSTNPSYHDGLYRLFNTICRVRDYGV